MSLEGSFIVIYCHNFRIKRRKHISRCHEKLQCRCDKLFGSARTEYHKEVLNKKRTSGGTGPSDKKAKGIHQLIGLIDGWMDHI